MGLFLWVFTSKIAFFQEKVGNTVGHIGGQTRALAYSKRRHYISQERERDGCRPTQEMHSAMHMRTLVKLLPAKRDK